MVWERGKWTWDWEAQGWITPGPKPPESQLKERLHEEIKNNLARLIGEGNAVGVRWLGSSTTIRWVSNPYTGELWIHNGYGHTVTYLELESSSPAIEWVAVGKALFAIATTICSIILAWLYLQMFQTAGSVVNKIIGYVEKAGPAFGWGILLVVALFALGALGARVPKPKEKEKEAV